MKSSRPVVSGIWQAAIIAMLLVGASFGRTVCAVPNVTNGETDATWIEGAIVKNAGSMDGAIGEYPTSGGTNFVEGYFANYACLGLARATQISGDQSYVNDAWAHLDWYASHVDSNGYGHDWDLISGTWKERPDSVSSDPYDSTDSYAATFLIAVLAAYRASNNLTDLQNLSSAIQTAVNAIHSTQQSNGLTVAKPGDTIEYLEDNVEVYQGLLAAGNLATTLGNSTLANEAYGYAAPMPAAFQGTPATPGLWDSTDGWYDWAEFTNNTFQATHPKTILAPDLMANGWAASFMVATGSNAQSVLTLETNFRTSGGFPWDDPTHNSSPFNYDVTPMGWGFYFNGDETTAQSAASLIRSDAVSENFAYPFTVADAGFLVILETDGEDLPFATPPEPSGFTAAAGNSQVQLSWSPTPGANIYNIYRSTTPGNETLYQSALSSTSFTDTSVTDGTTYYYTIGAFNDIGASPMSAEMNATPTAGTTVTTDQLNDWSIVNSKSANWELDTTTPADFNGDTSRAARTVNDTEYLIYKFPNISTFSAKVYIYIGPIGNTTFQVSTNNGSTYTNVAVNTGTETMNENNWGYYTVTPSGALPAGVTNLKVIFSGTANNPSYDPELSQISITHQ